MNAAYATLLGKLSGAAKLHLEHDQQRWLANRRACDANDDRRADFSAVNRAFADRARQSVDDVLQSEFDAGYEQTFDLYRLDGALVSVWIHGEVWRANFQASNTGTLVDLRTGPRHPSRSHFQTGR
jgi:hypothetical protein